MTASPESERERAETEAAAWLVRLAEDPDDVALRDAFEAWCAADRLNAEMWSRTSRAYALIGAAPRGETPQAHPRSRAGGAGTGRRATPRRRRILLAGSAAAVACLLAIAVPRAVLLIEADYATRTAELRSVVLGDGTAVRLAPESAIDVTFTRDERRIRLLKGEAFFEVTPDASRPFRVAAGDTVATVLGTAFDMRREDGGAAVAVEHGRVQVRDETTSPPMLEHLRAGDWLRVAPGGISRGTMPAEEVADWRRGELVARDRPVGEIIDTLRRHYPGVILLRDTAFATRRVSGIYSLADPVATLRGLAAAHGATVRQIAPWVLLITAG